MNFDGFDWDLGNVAKCEKHGVSREEIEFLFEHELRVAPDIAHSTREQRFRAVGAREQEERSSSYSRRESVPRDL